MDHLRAGRARAPSERLYQLLLRAYPRAFRDEYAAEMLLAFRDAYREAACERGTAGRLSLWADVLADFATSVVAQHARRWVARDGQGQLALALAAPFTLHVAQRSDVGRARASNEDCCVTVVPDDSRLLRARGALFVVSDGTGGLGRGEVASELVIQRVRDQYYQDLQDNLPTALQKAVKQAGADICRANDTQRARGVHGPDMGATCVAAVLHERQLYVASIGDSRVYVLHAGHLRQVTRDHSLVAQLVEQGALTAAEARTHPKRNLIYRALGIPDAEVDLFTEPIEEGDTLILCTDGLCGVVDDEELQAIVERYSPQESVQRLIARANARGGPDNITAIVARVAAYC